MFIGCRAIIMLFPLDTSTAFFSPAWLNMAHVLFPRRLFNLLHKFCGFTNISIKSISGPFPQKPLDRSSSPVLQYPRKDLKCVEGVMSCRGRSQRTGGRCEPGGGGVAAGAGAGRPKEELSSRAARICLRYPGRGLLEPFRVCAQARSRVVPR